ncbi:1,2-phenylacetyl-CoA epoxidase subunit PaaD [Salinibaculum rarum]|uniref:1,2-phenylacetyl-CoA epoxidase subunit PaaD n=1 Tax=Salinibaculum rarum TaxID=3058903 RepID=UPI00265EF4DF|nr:1,2-phenylacetyl-CoA epoxidase subunit PaaD [Salinibaculum sp. KK48]
MSSDYDRPRAEPDASPCSYTDYDTKEHVEGDVPATGEGAEGLEREVWAALYAVEDPEMPVSIVDLGLIYELDIDDGEATINMTLTYSGCPARQLILDDVEAAAESVDGIDEAAVELVWSPNWSIDLVTEQGKEALRDFGMSFDG